MSDLLDRMLKYQMWQDREAAHLRAYSTSPTMPELAEMHEETADALKEARIEIERLSKYETTVKRIAWDYIELSHDKAYNQRDEYIRWCRATIQEDKDRQ
jgi:hypothetical protein